MSELLSQLQQLGDGEIDDLSIAHDASEEIVALRLRVAELEDRCTEQSPAMQGEPVYLYRRRGFRSFETCNHVQYAELSANPRLFETKVLYTAPQPAPDVAGLVQQHHRDSAELRSLCQARDEQRDGRLAALERAAKAEADVAGLVEALEALLEVRVIEADGSYGLACAKAEQALAAYRKQGGEI